MQKDTNQSKQKRNHTVIHPRVILAILIIGMLLTGCSGKRDTYNSATQALENGDYVLALDLFEECKGFQDSNEKIIEATYGRASELLETGSYVEARKLFESIQQYSNAKDQILRCDYEYANVLLGKGDYYQAKELFAELDTFLDSKDMVMECEYEIACEQLENEIFDAARETFEELGNYKDSPEKLKEIDYQVACVYMESEDYEIARSMLVALGDYKNSKMHIQAIDCIPQANKATLALWLDFATLKMAGIDIFGEYFPQTYTYVMTTEVQKDGLWDVLSSLSSAMGERPEYDDSGLVDMAQTIYEKYFYPYGFTGITCIVRRIDPTTGVGEGVYPPETQNFANVTLGDTSPNSGLDYILPTDTQYITSVELMQLNKEEVVLARNEIYARHGYSFQSENIRTYFEGKSWYHANPNVNASTFGTAQMNDIERANLETIQQYEKDMGWK